jgi:hypothetical protein
MLGGRKITATLTGETLEGSVANCCLQRGILVPMLCCLVVDEITEGLKGVCTILTSRKFPNTVSQLLQEALSMEQQW